MVGRLWISAAILASAVASAALADEPVLLNADQISFQLSRTRSLRGAVVVSLPAVTFRGATDRLTDDGARQLETLLEALKRPEQANRTFVIRAAPAPSGPASSPTPSRQRARLSGRQGKHRSGARGRRRRRRTSAERGHRDRPRTMTDSGRRRL